MAEITHLSPLGLPGRAYGAFVAKSGTHPVGLLTQLSLLGLPSRRYGSFSGRSFAGVFNLSQSTLATTGETTVVADSITITVPATPHPVGILTQLSPLGLPSRRYEVFEGRNPTELPLDAPAELNFTGHVGTTATIAYGILKELGTARMSVGGHAGTTLQQIEYLEPNKYSLGNVSLSVSGYPSLDSILYSYSLSSGDIQAIVDAFWAHPNALTFSKWITLK